MKKNSFKLHVPIYRPLQYQIIFHANQMNVTGKTGTQTKASQRIVTTKQTKRFRQNDVDFEKIEESCLI